MNKEKVLRFINMSMEVAVSMLEEEEKKKDTNNCMAAYWRGQVVLLRTFLRCEETGSLDD